MTVRDVIEEYSAKEAGFYQPREALIPLLQKVQGSLGFFDKDTITAISKALKLTENEVYGVATFYAQFRFTPRGKHNIKVCLGTACHVRGGEIIMDAVKRELGVEVGGVTSDRKFDLERVACIGCCALAPVVVVDDKDVHAKMIPSKVRDILKRYE
jgi:NADH-quinone oxidoreductase subunit E